jgi:hypothetical protein
MFKSRDRLRSIFDRSVQAFCRVLPYAVLLVFLLVVFVTVFLRARMPLPAVIVDQEIRGWTLVGYQVDESRLARSELVDLKLYWRVPVGVKPIKTGDFYHQAGNQWVQVVRPVQNLVVDGGFEGGEASSFLSYDIYDAAPETRQFVSDMREGQLTIVANLRNTQESQRTSFVSAPIEVRPDCLYLQTGWLRSEAGRGYLGREWLPGKQYDYVVGGVTSNVWTHHAQVVQPPTGTTEARIWLLNFDSEGQVYFDDVVFVELGQIIDVACSSTDSDSPHRCGPPLLTDGR